MNLLLGLIEPTRGAVRLGSHALSDFELRRRMQRAIESLPDEQRTAFVLRMENELSVEDIAAVTGVPTAPVPWLIPAVVQDVRSVLVSTR